jgi:hypothetical protein
MASDGELLAFILGLLVMYLVVSIGYRRFLFQWLPDPDEFAKGSDEPVGPGEQECPHCGTINSEDFEKCYECARRLPDPTPEDSADA